MTDQSRADRNERVASLRPDAAAAPDPGRRTNRRASIELAAAELFAEKGYAGTGVAEIADRVGITPGAIYRHFNGKDDILRSIVASTLDAFAAIAAAPEDERTDARLIEQVRGAVALTQAQPARVAIPLRERYSLSDGARQGVAAQGRHLAHLWQGAIRRANPTVSADEAAVRLRMVNGVLASLARRPDSGDPARVRDLFTGSLVAMLLTPAARRSASDALVSRPQWSPPRLRRQRIREISAQLFRKYGYHGVGMDEIGTRAGISGPTVYGTYAGKSEILVDVCDHAVAKVSVALEDAIGSANSAPDALQRILQSSTAKFFASPDVIAVLENEIGALAEPDRIRINRHRSDYYAASYSVLAEVRPELDDREVSMLFVAAGSGILEVALARSGGPTVEEVANLGMAFLLGEQVNP